MRLEGKRVLITGTAGGQGEAAQRLFAAEGARVVGCDLQDDAADKTAAVLREQGLDAQGDTVDLSDATAAGEWVDSAAERLGGIDVLYNNAAGFGFAPFAEMTHELFSHVLKVELELGNYFMTLLGQSSELARESRAKLDRHRERLQRRIFTLLGQLHDPRDVGRAYNLLRMDDPTPRPLAIELQIGRAHV